MNESDREGSASLTARALFAGATVFVVTGTTICMTTGALFWGGASLVGIHGAGEAVAGLVGCLATLPLAAWLGWRAYRVERSLAFGRSAKPRPAGGGRAQPA